MKKEEEKRRDWPGSRWIPRRLVRNGIEGQIENEASGEDGMRKMSKSRTFISGIGGRMSDNDSSVVGRRGSRGGKGDTANMEEQGRPERQCIARSDWSGGVESG